MVFPQLTKPELRAVPAGWQRVADLHLAVADNHAINQEFDELPTLGEAGRRQPGPHARAEVLDALGNRAQLQPLLGHRVQLALLGEQLQTAVVPESASVSDTEIEDFYRANQAQFEQPETRDVRVILNPDEGQIEDARSELGTDPTPADWKAAAKKYSTDEATKNQGGLRQDVAEGQNEAALDEAIFSSPEGELVSEQDQWAARIVNGSWPELLGWFYLGGLLLSFTPCVLPMVPILSSIIAGQGTVPTSRGFALSVSYVRGMAST